MSPSFYGDWRRYVPMSERRRNSARAHAALRRSGREVAPVAITGRKLTTTFWGDAWCRNLESYSDYANRLPRGRTYLRNGSVIDLRIQAGSVLSLVSGSEIYETRIRIAPLPQPRWKALQSRCAGQIDSVVELLRGSLSRAVMEIVTEKGKGLFPSPKEISLDCSCPDWALVCKHLAATLYGVGSRLDREPGLLFALRGVDPVEMVAVAAAAGAPGTRGSRHRRTIAPHADLSAVFGIDLEESGAPGRRIRSRPAHKKKKAPTSKRPVTKKRAATKKKKAGGRAATRKESGA
jgi:uncharacterized Zn finger protein